MPQATSQLSCPECSSENVTDVTLSLNQHAHLCKVCKHRWYTDDDNAHNGADTDTPEPPTTRKATTCPACGHAFEIGTND